VKNANKERFEELKQALDKLPRVELAHLPTPFDPCPGLTRTLGGPEIWIKRDDMTGLATGGNKTRMFEYTLGKAIENGVEAVVGGAAVQSNYCRQMAAACAKLGLECHLVLRKVRGAKDDEIQGGLLLDLLVGAQVEIVDVDDWVALAERVRQRGQDLEAQGKKVWVGRVGDESTMGLHACAYAHAAVELVQQAEDRNVQIDQIWVCSADTTQAGLALALKHMESPARLVGVTPLHQPIIPKWTFAECFAQTSNETAEILGLSTRLQPADITSLTDYVGADYGVSTAESREALRLLGQNDGVLLDPVYTGKAMAGLIDHVRRGLIGADKQVVFLHTGGLPALFAYAETLELEDLLSAV
jgi:L-cysteate sulfo-lyase